MALCDGISDAQYQSIWDRIRSGEDMNWWSKVGRRSSADEETAIYSTTVTCEPSSIIHLEVLWLCFCLQAKLSDHRFSIAKHDSKDKLDADSYAVFGPSQNLF